MSSTLKLCAAVAVLLVAAPRAFAQGGTSPTGARCPAVRVVCPDSSLADAPATFKAEVTGGEPSDRLTYSWTTSAGTITEGQGTPSVTVAFAAGEQVNPFTATVKVGGLSAACPSEASCTTNACTLPLQGRRFDAYNNVSFEDERARLNNFAVELQHEPAAMGYLICYGGRRGRRGEAQARCDRAKDYVVRERGIDPARMVTIDGGFREELTVEPWIVPAGATPPVAAPTVEPADVQAVTEEQPRRARRRN
ncbi:MAG TPA: hypothetical protein VER08_05260 [Pyrinomonadaceae bacterium]|nr:hypothetical protein [Pyrinomonadaceae bacterium]